MKKKTVLAMLVMCMVFSASACSDKSAEKSAPEKTESSAEKTDKAEEKTETKEDTKQEEEKTEVRLVSVSDISKYITVGEYKGLKLNNIVEPVSDPEVDTEIEFRLQDKAEEVKGGTAQSGDQVRVSFTGTIDGKSFEGGSEEDYDLVIGEGAVADGFDEGIVGMKAGETKELNLTFPEDYTQDLAGKAVEFTVTVNAVKEPLSEPTDQWVADNIEGYDNIADYKAGIRSEQEESNEQTAENQVRYAAWTQVIDNCTINEYPETLVEVGKKLYEQQVETYAKYAGMELDAYIESSGLTQEEYQSNMEEYGKNVAAQALVCQAICDKEGFAIGDDDYQKALQDMLTEYGCTEDELIQTYGQDNVEQSIMLNRVSNLILENANVTEVQADSSADSSSDDSGN